MPCSSIRRAPRSCCSHPPSRSARASTQSSSRSSKRAGSCAPASTAKWWNSTRRRSSTCGASTRSRRSSIGFECAPTSASDWPSPSRRRCAWDRALRAWLTWTTRRVPSSCSRTSLPARSATTPCPSSSRGCSRSTVPSAPVRAATGSAPRSSSTPRRSSPIRTCRLPAARCAAGIDATLITFS
jgi:hypothetical protein